MLSTLDVEQNLYVILSGITSGDGLGFNRAYLFLVDEAGRRSRSPWPWAPPAGSSAAHLGQHPARAVTLTDLLERYESYRTRTGQTS